MNKAGIMVAHADALDRIDTESISDKEVSIMLEMMMDCTKDLYKLLKYAKKKELKAEVFEMIAERIGE